MRTICQSIQNLVVFPPFWIAIQQKQHNITVNKALKQKRIEKKLSSTVSKTKKKLQVFKSVKVPKPSSNHKTSKLSNQHSNWNTTFKPVNSTVITNLQTSQPQNKSQTNIQIKNQKINSQSKEYCQTKSRSTTSSSFNKEDRKKRLPEARIQPSSLPPSVSGHQGASLLSVSLSFSISQKFQTGMTSLPSS